MMYLEGVRVLDLSRILAGPMATQNLADLGADVLKVEPPDGDDTRAWGPPFKGDMAAYFMSCNRNKASLVLDLLKPEDRTRFEQLVRVADVVIDNYPPTAKRKLGLDVARLNSLNPSLVSMNITGYRATRVDEPGYDIMIQAESGLMGVTGSEESGGFKTGVAIVDVLTGILASNGILAAMYRRQKTGKGAHLSISLYQTALMSLVNVASNYLVSGKESKRWGNAHPNIVPYQQFQLADRAVIIGTGNDRQFQRLCALLDINDPAFVKLTNAERVANRKMVLACLSAAVQDRHSSSFLAALKREKIPCAPILSPGEAMMAVRGWDAEALFAVNHAELGRIELVNNPLVGMGMRREHSAPPLLGEGGAAREAAWLAEGLAK